VSFRGRRPRSSSVSLPYPSVLTKRIRTHATRTHTHIHHAFFAFRWMAARAVVYLAARAVLYPVCLRSLPRMRAPRLDKHGPGMHASERGALVRLSLIICRDVVLWFFVCRSLFCYLWYVFRPHTHSCHCQLFARGTGGAGGRQGGRRWGKDASGAARRTRLLTSRPPLRVYHRYIWRHLHRCTC
jgi:hypothetical protein